MKGFSLGYVSSVESEWKQINPCDVLKLSFGYPLNKTNPASNFQDYTCIQYPNRNMYWFLERNYPISNKFFLYKVILKTIFRLDTQATL